MISLDNSADPNQSEIEDFDIFYNNINQILRKSIGNYSNQKDMLIGKIKRDEKIDTSFEKLFHIHLQIILLKNIKKKLDLIKNHKGNPDFYSMWINSRQYLKNSGDIECLSLEFKNMEYIELRRKFGLSNDHSIPKLIMDEKYLLCEKEYDYIENNRNLEKSFVLEKYNLLKKDYESILSQFKIVDMSIAIAIIDRLKNISMYIDYVDKKTRALDTNSTNKLIDITVKNRDYLSIIDLADKQFQCGELFLEQKKKTESDDCFNNALCGYMSAIEIINSNSNLTKTSDIKTLIYFLENMIQKCKNKLI